MKKILVTGGAGFIGSHLCERLLERGDAVTVIDDESTGSAKHIAPLQSHPHFRFIAGSVAEGELMEHELPGVDEVYHLAAAVGVALIAKKPLETIERNIYPTELLFSLLREQWLAGSPVKCFLASTSEVYGKNPKPVWSEDDDLVFGATTRPRWSYGASKAIDEFLALASFRECGLPVVIGRFFNVVGPRQTGAYGMVVPRFVDAAMAGRPLTVHDDGQQIRCFAHVRDVVGAVVKLMETEDAIGKVFNIGSDQPMKILDLAKQVIATAESKSPIQFESYAQAYDEDFEDIRRRIPDLTRLKNAIGYQPKLTLADVIRELVEQHPRRADRTT